MLAKTKKQRKKKPKEDMVFQTVFLVLTISFIGYLSYSNFKISRKRGELTKKIEALREEIGILEGEKEYFESGISQTEKDSYWEERARDQGYVREGENPVVIIPSEEVKEEEEIQSQNFFGSLSEIIKNLFAKVKQ